MAETRQSPWKPASARDTKYNEKHSAILAAAATILADKGYDAVSLNDVADNLGITKPTLYYYFKSKDELVLQVKQAAQDLVVDAITEAEALPGSGSSKLERLIRRYLSILNTDFVHCLITVDPRNMKPESRSKYNDRVVHLETRVRNIIEEGILDGSIRKQDPSIAVRAIFGLLNGLALTYRSDFSDWEHVGDEVMALIFEGTRPRVLVAGTVPAKGPARPRRTSPKA
jgi:AcrR family transcriptional regulator